MSEIGIGITTYIKTEYGKFSEKIQRSYDELYNKTGVQPNAVLISEDYMTTLESMTTVHSDVRITQVNGLAVIRVGGKGFIRACIIDDSSEIGGVVSGNNEES